MEGFSDIRVSDLLPPEPHLIVITDRASVDDVLRTLSANRIHCVPVTDSAGTLLGFVDYLDVLAFLLDEITRQAVSSAGSVSANIRTDDLNQLMARASKYVAANVIAAKLCNKAATNPTVTIDETGSMKDALALLGQGVHRLAVTRFGTHVVSMLTQSAVIAWLLEQPERLGATRQKTAADLGWTKEKKGMPLVVMADDVAVDALMIVRRSFHSSLPVISQDGTFVGVLSSTDLKMMRERNFYLLLESVENFLRDVRVAAHAGTPQYRVTCTANSTLTEIMTEMAREHVKSIAVVDAQGKLETIVTLTDIIKAMLAMPFSS